MDEIELCPYRKYQECDRVSECRGEGDCPDLAWAEAQCEAALERMESQDDTKTCQDA